MAKSQFTTLLWFLWIWKTYMVNCDLDIHPLSDCWTSYIISNCSWFFLLFPRLHKYLLNLIFFWPIIWLLPISCGSAEKLYIRAEIVISLCSKEDMLKATETAVCNLSEFYCCSKLCLYSCHLIRTFCTSSFAEIGS